MSCLTGTMEEAPWSCCGLRVGLVGRGCTRLCVTKANTGNPAAALVGGMGRLRLKSRCRVLELPCERFPFTQASWLWGDFLCLQGVATVQGVCFLSPWQTP